MLEIEHLDKYLSQFSNDYFSIKNLEVRFSYSTNILKFLNFDKYLDLNLSIFQLFNQVQILTILFLCFFYTFKLIIINSIFFNFS